MLVNYRIILLGLSSIAPVLCAGPQNSSHETSSTTPSVFPPNGAPNPIKAALEWLTSTTNLTSSGDNSVCSSSNSSAGLTGPNSTATTWTKTTDPAKAALDWLTSSPDDKSATPPTTTDSKDSSVVSAILSELEATHTSAAAANRLGPGLW